jgi:hypothetical protein
MAKAAKNSATERRRRLIDYLSDILTARDCPISPKDWYHFSFVAASYGAREAVDKLAARYDEWPQVRQGDLLSVVETLDKFLAQP